MQNKEIVSALKLLGQLMELHQENPFKMKSVQNAAFKLGKYAEPLAEKTIDELGSIEGVGKSMAQKIQELLDTGYIQELENLREKTPAGLIEMPKIKGLGPKKIEIIWKQLGIETIGELYYACNENRLIEAKGFGLKTQVDIKRLLEFTMNNQGHLLLSNALQIQKELQIILQELDASLQLEAVGQLKRNLEVISKLEFAYTSIDFSDLENFLETQDRIKIKERGTSIVIQLDEQVQLSLHQPVDQTQALQRFLLNTPTVHLHSIDASLNISNIQNFGTEQEFYAPYDMQWIPEVLRDEQEFVRRAQNQQLPKLISWDDLRGSLHNHSTWSDGIHTLAEMADQCAALGLEYLGICDHSKSAFYANGLSVERVLQQHAEIEKLNQGKDFKILKGIESDILGDGSLDYEEEVLRSFDFIVASVHSNLKMTEEKANSRLISAIENPFTQILGHPTGRLLLAREGYPINHRKIIDACAANRVAIELNANPLRLDLDWRHIYYAIEKGVFISINPDAHRKEGLRDMEYGIMVAQKAGLDKEHCLNAMSLPDIEHYFQGKFKK